MKGMNKEDLYEYAQFLDEQIDNELRKIEKDKAKLNALYSNYVEVMLELSEYMEDADE